MAISAFFLCGHLSPYGFAHLAPILSSSFDIKFVVIASPHRWATFREILMGQSIADTEFQHLAQRGNTWPKIDRLKSLYRNFRTSLLRNSPRHKIQLLCKNFGAQLLELDNVNAENFLAIIREHKPDLLLSAAYPQILSKQLLQSFPLGCVNFHPSLLPKFRGAHPHFWTIALGETQGGNTAHYMTPKLDDGDIIAQISFPICEMTYSAYYQELLSRTPDLVNDVENFFSSENRKTKIQDTSQATYFRNDREIHHRISWNLQTTKGIHNLCRTGVGFCVFRDRRVVLLDTQAGGGNRHLTNNVSVEPGTIIDLAPDSFSIKTIDGVLNVSHIYVDGKSLPISKFASKFRVFIGETLN